jgi:hypothetical protein
MGQTLLLASKIWLLVLIPGTPMQYTPMPDRETCKAVEQTTRTMYAMIPSNRTGYTPTVYINCVGHD